MVKLEAFLLILSMGLTLYSLIDCAQREDHQINKLPKWGWILLILFFGLLGSLPYLFIGRKGSKKINPPKPTKRVLPPDDDPDFLRKL